MRKSKLKLKGKVTVTVFDEHGNVKQKIENHNIVTTQGDAYIADILSNSPTRTKITQTSGYIPVGTNWTGVNPKNNTWVNTQTGSAQALASGYPRIKGSWGGSDANVLQFRAIYAAGSLNATITEAAITSHSTSGSNNSCLAYAQISPAAVVTTSDSLQIDWEITFLGT